MIETRHHGYIPHVVLLIVIELPALVLHLPAILSLLGDLVVILQPHRPQHQHGQADKVRMIRLLNFGDHKSFLLINPRMAQFLAAGLALISSSSFILFFILAFLSSS